MQHKTKLSIIIPVFNEEHYIKICLSSLQSQTIKPDEIIVINDGSTDNSLKIIQKYQSSKIKYFSTVHQGVAKARNLGAKKSQGDILIFLDADLKFDKTYLKNLTKPILKNQAQATFTKEEFVANQSNIWAKCWSINSYLPLNLHIDPEIGTHANTFRAIKKELFFKTKGYLDIGYGEDVTVLSQLKNVKAKVAKGAICYHYNPSSLKEVFLSARWMGRGELLKFSFKNLLIFSPVNSILKGLKVMQDKSFPEFFIFKLVFDFGVLIGLWERKIWGVHIK